MWNWRVGEAYIRRVVRVQIASKVAENLQKNGCFSKMALRYSFLECCLPYECNCIRR